MRTRARARSVGVAVAASVAMLAGRARGDARARLEGTRDDAVAMRVAAFAPCEETNARTRVEMCFEHDIASGDAACAIGEGTIRRARDGTEVGDSCGAMEIADGRVVVRLRTGERSCAVREGDAFRIEAYYECASDGRLFPYSTLLLGEVVALADSAIYLAEAAHELEQAVETQDEEREHEEDDRATSFTIYWPASF
jgi:hypothetical protein